MKKLLIFNTTFSPKKLLPITKLLCGQDKTTILTQNKYYLVHYISLEYPNILKYSVNPHAPNTHKNSAYFTLSLSHNSHPHKHTTHQTSFPLTLKSHDATHTHTPHMHIKVFDIAVLVKFLIYRQYAQI